MGQRIIVKSSLPKGKTGKVPTVPQRVGASFMEIQVMEKEKTGVLFFMSHPENQSPRTHAGLAPRRQQRSRGYVF